MRRRDIDWRPRDIRAGNDGETTRAERTREVSWASVYDIMTRRVPLCPRVIITCTI